MVMSTTLTMMASPSYEASVEFKEVDGVAVPMTAGQLTHQGGQGDWDAPEAVYDLSAHPALSDLMWADPGVAFGIISDPSSLDLLLPEYSTFLEENNRDDHDNDGINDLNDLDDGNDGIYDLIERFDGCYGTDPFDHDNDGILDADDYDDDNDGILEGPIDIPALEALGLDPVNVSTDRYVVSTTIHPLTGQPVGNFYLADQNPMDHDNDGVTDEDNDGAGPGRYDEDDDNDGRIDQFTWPCDFDNDGVQDYFDTDDDDDGILDVEDEHPYDASISTLMSASGMMFDAPQTWQFNDYRTYSGGVNFVNAEANRVNAPGAPASGFSKTIGLAMRYNDLIFCSTVEAGAPWNEMLPNTGFTQPALRYRSQGLRRLVHHCYHTLSTSSEHNTCDIAQSNQRAPPWPATFEYIRVGKNVKTS